MIFLPAAYFIKLTTTPLHKKNGRSKNLSCSKRPQRHHIQETDLLQILLPGINTSSQLDVLLQCMYHVFLAACFLKSRRVFWKWLFCWNFSQRFSCFLSFCINTPLLCCQSQIWKGGKVKAFFAFGDKKLSGWQSAL